MNIFISIVSLNNESVKRASRLGIRPPTHSAHILMYGRTRSYHLAAKVKELGRARRGAITMLNIIMILLWSRSTRAS
jgi:hypothetical protein